MNYCFDSKWIKEYEKLEKSNFLSETELKFDFCDYGIVLPGKKVFQNEEAGGLLDQFGNFQIETEISGYFGGKYDYNMNQLHCSDETIFLLPIVFHQWGHFLVDSLSWLWPLSKYKSYGYTKIGYTGNYFPNGIDGNYLEVLNLLGISQNDLIMISEPTQFKRVYYAERSFGSWINYHIEYKLIIEALIDAAMTRAHGMNLPTYNKIYFTRRNLPKSTEIGEKSIEKTFRINGFRVLAPESLSVTEQIWYINNADAVASLSGSVSLNAMFLPKKGKWTILNRMSTPNIVQYKINALFDVDSDFVDCYDKSFIENPLTYGPAQTLVCETDKFKEYLQANKMLLYQETRINRSFQKLLYFIESKKNDVPTNQNKIASYKNSWQLRNLTERGKKSRIIKFGHYPQHRNCVVQSPIEWQILSVENNKAFCVSKYALDFKKYNDTYVVTDWEQCSLRYWLNNTFISMAFSEIEQKQIFTINNTVNKQSEQGVVEKLVQDKVFLLSAYEIEQYIKSNRERKCVATDYALSKKNTANNKYSKRKAERWWLRSSGYRRYNSAFIGDDGSINYYGFYSCGGNLAVRPALWVSIE